MHRFQVSPVIEISKSQFRAGWLRPCCNSARDLRLNWQSSGAPLGQPAVYSTRVQTQLAQTRNRLMRVETIGPATIGDNLDRGIKRRRHRIEPAKIDLRSTRNMAHGKFIVRPDVQQGHRAIRQPGDKCGPADRLRCSAI